MKDQRFSGSDYTATKWESGDDKAKFANHFVRFVRTKCPKTLFVKWFYNRLSMCFGHIAHCNLLGFYETWFRDARARHAFLEHALAYPCFGDPAYTYSDVEHDLRAWIRTSGVLEQFRYEADTERGVVALTVATAAADALTAEQRAQLRAHLDGTPAAPVPTPPIPDLPGPDGSTQHSLFAPPQAA